MPELKIAGSAKLHHTPFFCGRVHVESFYESDRQSFFPGHASRQFPRNSHPRERHHAGRSSRCRVACAVIYHDGIVYSGIVFERMPARVDALVVSASHQTALFRKNPLAVRQPVRTNSG